MSTTSIHNPDRYMSDLRQILSQGRKRIGVFLGAGAPTALRIDDQNQLVEEGNPLVPDVSGLTDAVVGELADGDRKVLEVLKTDIGGEVTIEAILTQVRRLAQAIGKSAVHDLDGHAYAKLGQRICERIGVAQVFSVEPLEGENRLFIPYWALDTSELLDFLAGGLEGNRETAFTDKIFELKLASHEEQQFPGVDSASITVDTPLPFSLKRLWYELIEFELMTFEGQNRDQPALLKDGNAETLTVPSYKRHGLGARGPFLNTEALGIQRPLKLLRSRLLDRRYDFLLHPGPWEPNLGGKPKKDLDTLLCGWLGGPKPITILDLSGVPSSVLERLVGSILRIVYDVLFWSREKTEGGIERPLLIVMEEAHRYLSERSGHLAPDVVQRIAKEGRKYGVGAMVVSQRPSEVNETILSQCGTFFALRLSNPTDRARVQGTLPDGLMGLLDVLPILRTGEAVITGEAAKLPMRCRVTLPAKEFRPRSEDPLVSTRWKLPRRTEGYDRVVASWRAQRPRAVTRELKIDRIPVKDDTGGRHE